jgi:hypothetical protein
MIDDTYRYYIKTLPKTGHARETAAFHIHVDAQERLPEATTEALLEAGLTYDLFDPDWHFYGKDGDPRKPFGHHAPVQHMTFLTGNAAKYREMWKRTVGIVEQTPARCYIEGELIVLDEPLPVAEFDVAEFERLAPVAAAGVHEPFTYRSAIGGVTRSLPAIVKMRRLDPVRNGRRDRFRRGEMHLTLRDDTHPLLLELLCNLGFSVPAIPKLVESENGGLRRNPDGSFVTIRDIPLTLQTVDMRHMMRIANLAVTIIERLGGVKDGSIKIEFATHFAVLNGVDYNSSVPPVLDTVEFRSDFEGIGFNHLGSIKADLASLTRMTRERVRTSPHEDKIERFREIWARTQSIS